MYDERFGSYSIAATLAGMPSRRRLKSILRYRRLAPPPRWREVLRPLTLRPPDFLRPSTSVFSGVDFVISAKSEYVTKRRPGLVGLGLRIGICLALALEALEAREDRNGVALAHLHDRLLPRPGLARRVAAPLGLGLHGGRAHVDDLHVEQRLDRLADLRLVRVVVDAERVLAGGGEHVALLAHDRADDDLGVVHHEPPFARSVRASAAAWDSSSADAPTTSAMPRLVAGSTDTRARLRKESATCCSASSRTTRTDPRPAPSQSPRSFAAALVEGVSKPLAASKIASDSRSAWMLSALRNAARRSLRLTLKV